MKYSIEHLSTSSAYFLPQNLHLYNLRQFVIMPIVTLGCLRRLPQLQFIHFTDGVKTIDDLAKARISIVPFMMALTSRSVPFGIVNSINIKVGPETGKAKCKLLVRILWRIFRKTERTNTQSIKIVVFAIPSYVLNCGCRYNVINVIMMPKDGIVPQSEGYLVQESIHRMGHEIQGGHFHDKRSDLVGFDKFDFEHDAMWSGAESDEDVQVS